MRRHGGVVVGFGLVMGAAAVVLTPSPVGAAACTFDQVTHDDGIVVRTAIDGDGDRVAFSSTMDLTGENPDGNLELFLWDASNPSVPYDQLTVTTASANQPFFAIDDSGNRLAVLSPRNLPGADNADLNVEAFLYDRSLDTFVQLTTTTGANVNKEIAISGDGNRVAVTSSANLTGQNADGSTEVFVRTFLPNSTVQITSSPDGPTRTTSSPSIDLDGDRVVFESNANLVPPQNPGLGEQIFLRDLTAGTTIQLTNYPAGTFTAATAISANGAFVVHGTGQPIAGPNPDGNFEFYRTRLSNNAVVRLTDTTGSNTAPALSAAGDRLVWLGEGDLPAEGSDPVRNLNASDVGGSRNTVAPSEGFAGIEGLTMSADGTRLAFVTTLDLIGQNGSHEKALYVATCGAAVPVFTDVPRSNPFFAEIQWMHRAGVASGFPDGTFLPLDPVKRQQMANFLFNLAGNPLYTPPSVPDFTDVPVSHPMYQAIEWMAEFGIADGFPDGTFRPTLAVKRQQMANFLYNLAGEPSFTPPAVPTFTDVPTTNPFFLEIEWMAEQGIAAGFPDGTFEPGDPVKRQQMANFVYRFQRVTDLET